MHMTEKDFSMIVIPDTQDVCTSHPDKLEGMARWIVDHAEKLNLKMILHVGDVVNNGALREEQWHHHQNAFNIIDKARIPMLIAIGNHDYDNILNEDRSSVFFNRYCGMTRYRDKAWFGGTFEEDHSENMYALLEAEGLPLLFLSLEFGPRDEVLEWANTVLQRYSDRKAIIVTHSHMFHNGFRTQPGDAHNPKIYKGATGANDGEDVWNKCFKLHSNVAAVYSGHHIPANISYRIDAGDHGNLVFQSFQNWQCAPNGGDGRIRIIKFLSSTGRFELQVLNPQTGDIETDDGFAFSHPAWRPDEDQALWTKMRFPGAE